MRQQSLQILSRQTLRLQLGARLGLGLAHHQGLGLGKEIRQQNLMMRTDGVVTLQRRDEIRRDKLGALMDD